MYAQTEDLEREILEHEAKAAASGLHLAEVSVSDTASDVEDQYARAHTSDVEDQLAQVSVSDTASDVEDQYARVRKSDVEDQYARAHLSDVEHQLAQVSVSDTVSDVEDQLAQVSDSRSIEAYKQLLGKNLHKLKPSQVKRAKHELGKYLAQTEASQSVE